MPDAIDFADGGRRYRVTVERIGSGSGQAPLVVLLDGNQMFEAALRAAAPDAPPMILAGVGYPETDPDEVATRRWFELTDEAAPHLTPTGYGRPWRTGGADLFLRSLRDHVFPELLRRYEPAPDRTTLFGHSLAGLFALRTFLTRSLPVRRFVAADPSIWWNGHRVLCQLAEALAREPGLFERDARTLTILTAGRKVKRPDVANADVARMEALRAGPNGAEMARRLEAAGLKAVSLIEMPEETHGSLIEPALGRTLWDGAI